MARISYVPREQVPADAQDAFDSMSSYGPFANLVGALAQRPPIMRHLSEMLTELRDEGVLGRRYLELALVAVSKINECDYCVAHHGPMLKVTGISQAGVDRLLDFKDHPELDDVDKLVVDYARQVTEHPNRVRDAMFDRLREHFDEKQIAELTWRIALCGAFNRFNDVLQLEIEDEALQDVA